jgi:hypothetical protein
LRRHKIGERWSAQRSIRSWNGRCEQHRANVGADALLEFRIADRYRIQKHFGFFDRGRIDVAFE